MWSWYLLQAAWGGFGSLGGVFSVPFVNFLVAGAESVSPEGVLFFGARVLATSYMQLLQVVAIVVQLLCYLFLGALADFGKLRKPLIVVTTCSAAFFVMFVWICRPSIMDPPTIYYVASVFFVLASTSSGLSGIYLSSYLPLLARETLPHGSSDSFSRLSAIAAASGFFGALFGLVVGLGALLGASSSDVLAFGNVTSQVLVNDVCTNSTTQLRPPTLGDLQQSYAVLTVAGVYLLVFAFPAFLFLRVRPGLPPPSRRKMFLTGVSLLFSIWGHIRRLRDLFVFLLAYFFYGGGLATLLFSATVLFQTIPGVTQVIMGVAVVAAFLCAASAALGLMFLQTRVTWATTKRVLLVCIALSIALPLWGYFALTSIPEVILSAAYLGILMGMIGSQNRAAYNRMIPVGLESVYSTLFGIDDKAAAFLGPFSIFFINQATCSLRIAAFSIIGFLSIGFLVLLFCDLDRGQQTAKTFHGEVEAAPTEGGEGAVGGGGVEMEAGGGECDDSAASTSSSSSKTE